MRLLRRAVPPCAAPLLRSGQRRKEWRTHTELGRRDLESRLRLTVEVEPEDRRLAVGHVTVLDHVVDAAGTEGRDPVEDIRVMMDELRRYNEDLLKKPMLIAANKTDVIMDDGTDPVQRIREAFPDIPVYPISAFTHSGTDELIHGIWNILKDLPKDIQVFEKEFDVDYRDDENLPYTVEKQDGKYVVEGPRIEKMLGYTNLDSEKGFDFFQKFLKESGVLKQLEDLGIQDGDTVKMYGHEFDYYR